MKAVILKKVTVTVEPGSIVEVSEGQFKALGDKCVAYKAEAKEVEPVKPKKATSKKTSTKNKKE